MKYLKVTFSPKEYGRIFSKIDIDPITDCWNWTSSLDELGYGLVWYKKRTERSHRIIYAFFIKPIPRGTEATKMWQLDHLCRNRRCCNPKHLELVAQKTNVLRGNSPVAKNILKVICKYGHKLPKYIGKKRPCKKCDSIRHKKRMSGPMRNYWLNKANKASKRWYQIHVAGGN